jgi:hypothetical protein
VQLDLKTPWHDGTHHLVFELICHGLLASHARWRAFVVAYRRPTAEAVEALDRMSGPGRARKMGGGSRHRAPGVAPPWCSARSPSTSWRALPAEVGCLIATIHDPAVIRRILEHLRAWPSGVSSGAGPPHTLVTR